MLRQVLKQGPSIKNTTKQSRVYFSKKKQNKQQQQKVQIDQIIPAIEKKFDFKLKQQDFQQAKQQQTIPNQYRARQQTETPVQLQKHEKTQQQYLQQTENVQQQLSNKLQNKKNNLLKGLKKVDSEKKTFNSIFNSNEQAYFDKQLNLEQEKQKLSQYHAQKSQEQENAVDYYDIPTNLKQELSSFIHQQDNQLEQQVMAYLGFTEINSKEETIEAWRRSQVISNMDYTPETMGTKEVFYPGSKKGQYPVDDMESFGEWYKQNMPQPFKLILEDLQKLSEVRTSDGNVPQILKPFVPKEGEHIQLEEVDENEKNQPGDFGSAPAENIVYVSDLNAMTAPEIDDMPKCSPFEVLESMMFEDDSEVVIQEQTQDHELPILPEFMMADNHSSVDLIDKWSIFRLFPIIQHGKKQLDQVWQQVCLGESLGKQNTVMPTLFAYYNLLPEQVKHHPLVKTTVRNLEFYKHDMSLQDKLMAVNFACRMTMPMHPLVEEVVHEIIDTERYWITAGEEDAILQQDSPLENISDNPDVQPQQIEQVDKSMTVQEEWQRPEKVDPNGTDEILPDLPLQYYDNDDGFWDWHIQEQEQLYEKVDLPDFRPFFKH